VRFDQLLAAGMARACSFLFVGTRTIAARPVALHEAVQLQAEPLASAASSVVDLLINFCGQTRALDR